MVWMQKWIAIIIPCIKLFWTFSSMCQYLYSWFHLAIGMYIFRFSFRGTLLYPIKLINNTQVQAFQLYWSFIVLPKRERTRNKKIEAFSKQPSATILWSSWLGNVYLCIYVICSPTVSKHLENLISLVLIDCVQDNATVLSLFFVSYSVLTDMKMKTQ